MDETTGDEESIDRRAKTYRLLSACYRQPDEALLERLADTADETTIDAAGLYELAADPDELRLEYARLFVGPFEVAAPPYGSTYLDDPDRVMTKSTAAVEEWYRQEGLDIGLDEPPDHIAAELEFLGVLALAEREAFAADDREAAREYASKRYGFLSEHLGRWVSELADSMREHADTKFYSRLAEETQSFVERDGTELAARLDDSKRSPTGGVSDDS